MKQFRIEKIVLDQLSDSDQTKLSIQIPTQDDIDFEK